MYERTGFCSCVVPANSVAKVYAGTISAAFNANV